MTLQSWARKPGWTTALRWHMSRPFRVVARAKLPRGRGFFSRLAWRIAWTTVTPGSAIVAATPGSCSVEFKAETLMGRVLWMGAFEQSELRATFRLAKPGTYAFDVGANVGLFTVVMSRAVGPSGRVVALEPVADTAHQLRQNLARNRCTNVDIVEGAAAAASGDIPLYLTDDPALHSAGGTLIAGHPVMQTVSVRAYTLDELWDAAGRPAVSLVKIDVEGAEQGVLLGAARTIDACRPSLIIEVNDPLEVTAVADLLHGYQTEHVRGFEPWNHLLIPGPAAI